MTSDRWNYWVNFFPIHIQPIMNDSNSRNKWLIAFWKFPHGYEGCVWVGQSFLSNDEVTDKIIEWIFFQITFNFLWMTQTQEIITHRVLKIYKWIWAMCMSGGRFLKEWPVRDKIIGVNIFFKSHSTFYEWLKLKKW